VAPSCPSPTACSLTCCRDIKLENIFIDDHGRVKLVRHQPAVLAACCLLPPLLHTSLHAVLWGTGIPCLLACLVCGLLLPASLMPCCGRRTQRKLSRRLSAMLPG
jgi:hypothetical protein